MNTNTQEMTLLKHLDDHAANKPDEVYLVDRKNGEDVSYTFKQVHETVEAIAKSLVSLFGADSKKVSIVAKNRAHWAMCDFGVLRSGNILAPTFGTMTPETFKYAMEFADIKLLFVGEAGNWPEVKGVIPKDVKLVALPGVEVAEADYTFDEFLALGADTPLPAHPDPDALCTIVFTSGTTGMPKGVMHSLNTLYAFVTAVVDFAGEQDRFFSYLPLAHLGDRAATVFQSAHVGGRLAFNDSVETFVPDLIAAQPTFLMGVPRIWEKLLQGVLVKIGMEPEALKAKLAEEGGELLAQQIRAGLGLQNIRFLCAATAPTSNASKEWYARLGMPLHDVYGQTEVIPVTCSPGAVDGSAGVGPACAGFEVKIAESGEILARGPGMALGYYNNPEKTADTFVDGWVHTGDEGIIDGHGNLHITGRVQDTFKTSKGKYVAPVPIENKFAASPLVEQLCLHGFALTQPIMLCTLSESALANIDSVESELVSFAESINEQIEPHVRMAALILCKKPWSPEQGVLTHTLKVQRSRVAKAYEAEIAEAAKAMEGDERSLQVLWVD